MLLRTLSTAAMAVVLLAVVLLAPAAGQEAVPASVPVTTTSLPGLPSQDAVAGLADQTTATGLRYAADDVVSEPVATEPFSLVGFRVPAGAVAAFRTSVDGQEWGPWTPVDAHADEGPDAGSPEAPATGSDDPVVSTPTWVGEARWLQTRVSGARPEQVGVELVDSLGLSRGGLQRAADAVRGAWQGTPRAAEAAPAAPRIVARAQWGADESLRSGSPRYAARVRFGVVHHTVNANDYTAAQAPAVIRGIYAYHTKSNGWADIGYSFLVDRFGTVYEGRFGGVEEAVIGSHAGGFNSGSFGVALVGDFSTTAPSAAAMDALTGLLAWKYDVHHVDVTSQVDVTSGGSTRYPAGQQVRLNALGGHRDVSSTTCPGGLLYSRLAALRTAVADRQGDVILDPRATPSSVTLVRGAPAVSTVEISATLRPAGAWTVAVAGPDGTVLHRDAGSGTRVASTWRLAGAMAKGRYTVTIASTGRRPAVETVVLAPAAITGASASPSTTSTGTPVRITAQLDAGVPWAVEVTGPDGTAVHGATGTGQVSTSFTPAVDGAHRWTITAPDAEPARGTVTVGRAVLERIATAADAVGGAVELSQATFAVDGEAGRAVLARHDVFADAMTGGPLAGPHGPVLLTGSDRLDDRVRSELQRVLARGATVYLLGGEKALAPALETELRRTWEVRRLSGATRIETAARVAAEVVADSGAATAMVARSGPDSRLPWADALAGGAYGAAHGIPVLLTTGDVLAPATRDAVADLGIRGTIVLGGTAAVSTAVERALPGARRVSGPDRAATAVAVATELWGRTSATGGDRFLLTGGYRTDAWTLALAGSALAARSEAPLLLAEASRLPPATGEYLRGLGYAADRPGTGWVLGREVVVGGSVVEEASRLLR